MNFSLKLARQDDLVPDRVLIMAIFNATPDSFSDGGELESNDDLDTRIHQVLDEGADIIDVGGESTRPGFSAVDEKTEIERVVPVIKAIREISKTVPISIDTQKSSVAQAALEAGASFINDISSLTDPKMAEVAENFDCSVVLMRNRPLTDNLISSCREQFSEIIKSAINSGLEQNQLILDPGLGFGDLASKDFSALPGSDVQANLDLVKSISDYSLNYPVLIGGSRKRFIGDIMNEPNPKKRVSGSVEIAVMAARSGASILRVHDVAATISGLRQAGLRAL